MFKYKIKVIKNILFNQKFEMKEKQKYIKSYLLFKSGLKISISKGNFRGAYLCILYIEKIKYCLKNH